MPGQSRRRWSSLHNLQGNLTFRGVVEGGSTSDGLGAVTLQVALDLSDFFFFFVFFCFFLGSWLFNVRLSPGEGGEEEEETGAEGVGLTLESTCHGSDEGDS